MRRFTWVVLGAILLSGLAIYSSNTVVAQGPARQETREAHDARMAWWRDARFGMFVHWGLYSELAGDWKEYKVNQGGAEWIMSYANIPRDEYRQLAQTFNPTGFDAAAWVATAKNAGCKYIVVTSKHHEGFSIFDASNSKYDIVDGTPYQKDTLAAIADECRKQGIHFCTYYSIMDWDHPSQTKPDNAYNPTGVIAERKQEYVDYMKEHLRQLVQDYGTEVLWFDGEWVDWWTEEDAQDLCRFLWDLNPNLIINNRVGKGRRGMNGFADEGKDQEYSGDFGTPEQELPAMGRPGVDWETCITMNTTWGFNKNDHQWKSRETLVRQLVDAASKGGNYLLNVGPTAAGEIPPESIERLAAMGDWMKIYGESIYGTTSNPFPETPWGRCTVKAHDGGTTLYVHLFGRVEDGKLVIPAFLGGAMAKSAKWVGGDAVEFTVLDAGKSGTEIIVPTELPNTIDSVIAIEY